MTKATFAFTREDALALAQHYYFNSPTVMRSRRWAQILLPLIMILLAVSMLRHEPADLLSASPFLIVAAAWVALYPRFYNWYLLHTAEKMFKECGYEKAFGSWTIILTEEGISSSSPMGEGKFPWSGVNRVSLTASHLLIFLAGPQGFSIPRNQFPDAAIQEMKSFAEKCMKPSSQPRQ